jgi:hypothetical protein
MIIRKLDFNFRFRAVNLALDKLTAQIVNFELKFDLITISFSKAD